ncbi:uncharacterized protein N0V89_011048 [Didymosphaeria variabile]|uniref:Uncharacterized protein n=1 Tax=Didymosphaeria variabile TaxID=1932322 RepID=A0A9W8XCT0_9PLEO|nr:uncharacterized protein N0V89_011048 [Didymosphaeria variabile]KAJ4347110.1 hypothetical protein N0V89_011048 [Didymosphaeria variabile]
MFQFSGGLLAGQHDNEKERSPPARPIPVTFPILNPPEPSLQAPPQSWTRDSGPGVAAHFLGLKKPSDVNLDTLALLNVSFQPECDFETLLASVSNDAPSYLPPRSWLKAPDQNTATQTEPGTKLLCNGRRVPDHNEFYLRAKEICFSNRDAFANLTRKPMGEKVPLRLAHFRKFWEGLDNMAYYWDNSLDEYLPPKLDHGNADLVSSDQKGETQDSTLPTSASPSEGEPRKKVKTESTTNETAVMPSAPVASNGTALPSDSPISANRALPARAAPPKAPWEVNAAAAPEKPADLSKGAYKGYRIGNGAEMPDSYRLETTPAEIWKTLKPGNPLWDPKVVYEAIGKDRNTSWDDVFMVSSLNHHISILKLRIHPDYLQFLAEGTLPQEPPADPDWFSPKLQRTRWFDLFNIDDRIEAMRGVWGIMNYLMRTREQQDVPMTNT